VRGNIFGAREIAGVRYGENPNAWRASDSGRSDRPNLFNIDIIDNQRNGEGEKGCDLPDPIVVCSGNAR
jgi:hypothetical protein